MIIALQMLILFRESVLAVLNGWLPPFFRQLVTKFSDNGLVPLEDETDEQVYAYYDGEYGVVFFPPIHAQRYAAVCDCLMDERWFGKLEKVLNIGKHYDINFMKYLTELSGITHILGLDISSSLNCTCDIQELSFNDYETWGKPMQITLLQGNAADPDYRLLSCDAILAIEIIQKLLPHDLDRLVHNIFGFVKPRIAVFTTPNADFNCLMKGLSMKKLRQPDHYFEWSREQLHDWCSNIVIRYPEYMVTSRGVGPGPTGTSHCGCYTQLVLFIAKQYKKEMEFNVNSLVLVPNLPEPEEMVEIDLTTPTTELSSHTTLHRLSEEESSDPETPEFSSRSTTSFPDISPLMKLVTEIGIQCNLEAELGKSFVMFNDEMYQIRMPRKSDGEYVYEIGDTTNRLNNTMYDIKKFSRTTQYLIEKNEISSEDLMDEILQLTERLSVNMNRGAVKENNTNTWNNTNWGENVPYWNQYYKLVAVYNFPCEGKSEDETILELLSEEIDKLLDAHNQGEQFGIPVHNLMDAVKHITSDVERVIMLMEDNGYELEGDSVVYTGSNVSDGSPGSPDKSESRTEFGSISNGSSYGKDSNGRVLNRTLGRKVRKLRLMLDHDDDVKQTLAQVVCRLKKIAKNSGRDKHGTARSKWLQSKLLDILTLTEKSILRRKLRNIDNDPLRGLFYDTSDKSEKISKIMAEDEITSKIVEKYETILRMSEDDLDDSERDTDRSFGYGFTDGSRNSSSVDLSLSNLRNEKDYFEYARETDVLSSSPNDELARYKFDGVHNDSPQDWGEKDMSVYQEETNEHKIRKRHDISPSKRSLQSRKEAKTNTKQKKSKSSDISINKKKPRHCTSLITVKRSVKYNCSRKNLERKIESAPIQEKHLKKRAYDDTYYCIEKIGKKMGNTLVLSVPPKPIPDSILKLCHPDLHQKTVETVQKESAIWDDMMVSPVATTELSQKVDILSHSHTVTIALQRMIGTDPLEDTEVYKREFGLPNVTNFLNETPPGHVDVPGSPGPGESNIVAIIEESNVLQSGTIPPVSSIAATVVTPVIEILTEDKREMIALQRTIGTDPEVDTEVCEREVKDSKLTSSLNDFEKVVLSEEFFLYDINEPTTSKGLRHVGMDVQCGTDGLISATTSYTFPLRKFATGIKIGDSGTDIRTDLKTDCVTSTNDILKPCVRGSSHWIKSLGIKIKDSNPRIVPLDNEINATIGTFTAHSDENYLKSLHKDSMEIETLQTHQKIGNNKEIDSKEVTTKAKSNSRQSSPNKSKRLQVSRPKSNIVNIRDSIPRRPDPSKVVTRFLDVPKGVRSKLSCGGIHVHSFKDLKASEDVMYQGEWQQHQQKSVHKSLLKKPNRPSTDKMKSTRRLGALIKPQKVQPKTIVMTPIIIRNTKANKMKEKLNKINLQNKLAPSVPQVPHKPGEAPKVSSKLSVSYSKPIMEQSKNSIQPLRRTRFAPQTTIINDVKIPNARKRVYVPPYLHRLPKNKQFPKTPNKVGVKTDSLSNFLNVNEDQITSMKPRSKVDDLVSALLKVSFEPENNIYNYVIYRNERDSSTCSTAIERKSVPSRCSKENILRRKLSNLSQKSSAYSSSNSTTTVLNPVVTITKRFQHKRQSIPMKTNITRIGSESKMLSKIKKLAKMFSKKSHTDVTDAERVPDPPVLSQLGSKNSSHIELTLDGPTSNPLPYCQVLNTPDNIKSCTNSSDNMIMSISSDKSKECVKTQDSTTFSIENCHETKTQELVNILPDCVDDAHTTISDYTNNTFDEMKLLVEECFYNMETIMIANKDFSDMSHLKSQDENGPSNESETYETGSSFHRTHDDQSLASITQSFTDFPGKLPSTSWKISACLENSVPRADYENVESKKTASITQESVANHVLSSYSVEPEPNPVSTSQHPDYVNLVDSETGSGANVNTRATSEEVLVSERSSDSYVSCTVDEDATIPSWLYNISQQASGSFSSGQHPDPEVDPELEYDVNGNELTVHGAGAGDGYGIHSDQSQDSSGQGTSFSSSATSSGAPSESVVVDPATLMAEYEGMSERANTSNAAAPVIQVESTDTSVAAVTDDIAPRTFTRPRIPRITHRVSLPASDADISSIDTDIPSDS